MLLLGKKTFISLCHFVIYFVTLLYTFQYFELYKFTRPAFAYQKTKRFALKFLICEIVKTDSKDDRVCIVNFRRTGPIYERP